MYSLILTLHNLLRWVVLIVGLIVLARSLRGWFGARPWGGGDRRLGLLLTVSLDIQLLLGILLTAVSPLMRAAFQDFGAVPAVPVLRYFVMEHVPVMVLAVLGAHLTSVLIRRAQADRERHRRSAIGYGLVMLAVVLAIPWWRALLPGLS